MSIPRIFLAGVATVLATFVLIAPPLGIAAERLAAPSHRNISPAHGIKLGGGKTMAILIGVQNHVSLSKLKYFYNDVSLLEETLTASCRFDRVVALMDGVLNPTRRPTLGNVVTQLSNWLHAANNGDYQRVVLSGHCLRDKSNRLYFAPPDCNRRQLELTGLPQSYANQQVDACTNAPVKFLVLDCRRPGEGRRGGVSANGSAQPGRLDFGWLPGRRRNRQDFSHRVANEKSLFDGAVNPPDAPNRLIEGSEGCRSVA